MEVYTRVCVVSVMCLMMTEMAGAAGRYQSLTAPVMTTSGPIVGEVLTYSGTPVHRYLGVPYAAPPLGELRFAPPQPPQPWNQTRYTMRYGNRCISYPVIDQYRYFPPRTPPAMSEDCLYLNIAVPKIGNDKKAVMVFIHGGTLLYGSGSDQEPEALAISGDVIHVTINYRLNVFGFLATMNDSAPGNVGMLDQVLALRWIQQNIASFGGDPDRVTIFGISAGGWSVSAHLVSPLSRGLFHRAICQSGSLYGLYMKSRQDRTQEIRELAKNVRCAYGADDSRMLDCLRSLPADEIFQNFQYQVFVSITTGDDFMPESLTRMFDHHRFSMDVTVIACIVSEEGSNILFDFISIGEERALQEYKNGIPASSTKLKPLDLFNSIICEKRFDSSNFNESAKIFFGNLLRNHYFVDLENSTSNLRDMLDMYSDSFFAAPTLGMLDKLTAAGVTTYLYYFDQTSEVRLPTKFPQYHLLESAPLKFGTFHSLDSFYMFGYGLSEEAPMSVTGLLPEDDKILGRSMVYAWTHFAKSGRTDYICGDNRICSWQRYEALRKPYLLWKYPMTPHSVRYFLCHKNCQFWNSFLPNAYKSFTVNDSSHRLPSLLRFYYMVSYILFKEL